ncbi:hypothetical protein amb3204 [Paramagnetospirillum magneticum AMB-1]|uniref:Pterin-binding domain-containing protein n=1 Tax=Paramagnetospirillum magneticum (strain ATCC 700264 / AMB-1) TaxID=342108 RepID=Q2W2B7_PARM1|nr:dihydropteroate synthase [Paramagnetospirillum magneticum]BAE52008.1 hypothetical protein amb3204 [Paramagnetospirillum magneticum AMB-1]
MPDAHAGRRPAHHAGGAPLCLRATRRVRPSGPTGPGLRSLGIARQRICLDPGIGFGKTPGHCAQVLGSLALLHGLGLPLLLGVSRKSFVARLSRDEVATARLPGTLAANLAGLDAGFQVLRVHDVPETAQALAIWTAMRSGA